MANFELIDAYYSHCVKELYRDYVTNVLVDLSKDDLDYYRKLALDILLDLISSKPEIEDIILGILINKLGDQSKKVQMHAIHVLSTLLKNHHKMAPIIVHETHVMLQRPGIKPIQKYYSVAFLNKISVLCAQRDPQVRLALFRVYFFMFKNILQNPEERKAEIVKKDRSKSKKQQTKEKIKALKQLK